jgi:hypothetical protein
LSSTATGAAAAAWEALGREAAQQAESAGAAAELPPLAGEAEGKAAEMDLNPSAGAGQGRFREGSGKVQGMDLKPSAGAGQLVRTAGTF